MAKLIMIDDNPIEHLIMKKMFERYAIFPDAVHSLDGRSVISFLKEHLKIIEALPDLIFLDLYMPEYSGWDFLEDLKLLYPYLAKPIPVYIVSSSIDPLDHTRASRFSFLKSFVVKPLSKESLTSINFTAEQSRQSYI
ncbi:response regulator [Mucilaginibacter sp. PAMB04274]|uniref:response regulator n=1 Tax=Mucilaginibacter sp. PAMB04274 TaxID=3138568 RepID=UPI0031F66615